MPRALLAVVLALALGSAFTVRAVAQQAGSSVDARSPENTQASEGFDDPDATSPDQRGLGERETEVARALGASGGAAVDARLRTALRVPLLDLRGGEAREGRVPRIQAWASAAFFSGAIAGGSATVVAPSLGLRLALGDELDGAFDWTIAYAALRVIGEYRGAVGEPEPFDVRLERVEAGNPTFEISWSPRLSSQFALRVGLGTAFPVAALTQVPSDVRSAAERAASSGVHETMLAMHGGLDPWRFFPERLSFFVPVRVALSGDAVLGSLGVAGAWAIPVLGGSGRSEGAIQFAGELVASIVRELRIGLRASVVGWRIGGPVVAGTACRIGDAVPRMQPALEPWVRVLLGPAYGVLRATVDVGCDLGLGSAAPVWAVHLGGGAALEREERE